MNTRLTYLKPLLKKVKSEGATIRRVSPDSVAKGFKDGTPNPIDVATLTQGPNAAGKVINIPKFKSKAVSKATGFDTSKLVEKGLSRNPAIKEIDQAFRKSPEGVIAHELGHVMQNTDKMRALQRRTNVGINANKFVERGMELPEKIKAKDMTGAKRTALLAGRDLKRIIKGKTSDVIRTEGDASSKAMAILTQAGMDKKKLDAAGKGLQKAYGTYDKQTPRVEGVAKKLLDLLPGD